MMLSTTSIFLPRLSAGRSLRLCAALFASMLFCGEVAQGQLTEVRTITGAGNNLANPSWGEEHTPLLRIGSVNYADGVSAMITDLDRTNVRDVSNAIADQAGTSIPNSFGLTNYVWQWGQFLDHDISLSDASAANGSAPIALQPGDLLGPAPLPFDRTIFDPLSGTSPANPRQQVNEITSYVDGSVIYGSTTSRAMWLRELSGGRLRESAPGVLPFNDGTQANAMGMGTNFFVSGDVRANEQVGLIGMHTLFMREHNRLAGLIEAADPLMSDEDIYQYARRIVGAQIQIITYNEFLPALLGSNSLAAYSGYDDSVDASIANEFSTAMYRFGHTMLPPDIPLVNPDGSLDGTIALRDAFFAPEFFADTDNYDRVFAGLFSPAQEIDHMLADDVRNFLFGPPGAGGLDLASLNLQRGRDHGLPDYNSMRLAYGLLAKDRFLTDGVLSDGVTPNGITDDPVLAAELSAIYGGDINNVDAWIGGLAEDQFGDSPLSELVHAAMIDQFTRLRDGDRFFYLNDSELLNDPLISSIIDLDDVTLGNVLSWNTGIQFLAGVNVFRIPEPSTIALGLMSVAGLALFARRRRVTSVA